MHHPGTGPGVIHEGGHDGRLALSQDRSATALPQGQPSQHSTHHLLLDPSQIATHSRIGTPQFDTTGAVMGSVYSTMSGPMQTAGQHHSMRAKRQRTDDLDYPVSSMSHMAQAPPMASLHGLHMGPSYAQVTASTPSIPQPHPTHHHHRLPDSEPSAKMMRRDEGGGAPSVVGQEGMPQPAARPRGPKLKFTTEDDQLLIELKEQKNLTWKQIADFFPGRSSGTLQVRYCTKLKAKTKQWNEDMDQKLQTALEDYENEKWRIVSSKLGAGFTPAACRERVDLLWGGGPVDFEETSTPPEQSVAEPTTELYGQRLGYNDRTE